MLTASVDQLCGVRGDAVLDANPALAPALYTLEPNSSERSVILTGADVLGRGGFCNVHQAVYEDKLVALKSPRTEDKDAKLAIYAELTCLRSLAEANSENIPKLVAVNAAKLDVTRNGVAVQVPASLALWPVGKPLADILRETSTGRRNDLAMFVARGVMAALREAHSRGWLHCDVRPSNIVLVAGAEGEPHRVVLIDWGLSLERYQHNKWRMRKGVYGVAAWLHDDILTAYAQQRQQEYIPCPTHDLASAALVIAAVAASRAEDKDGGEAPWLGSGDAAHDVLQSRRLWLAAKYDALDWRIRKLLRAAGIAPSGTVEAGPVTAADGGDDGIYGIFRD